MEAPLFLEADSLVFATPNLAEDTLARELEDSGLKLLNIGDSAGPRQAPFVISEARRVALEI